MLEEYSGSFDVTELLQWKTYSNGNGSGALKSRANSTIVGMVWFILILLALSAVYLIYRVYVNKKYLEYNYAKAHGESTIEGAKLGNQRQMETERQLAEAFTQAAGSTAATAISGIKGLRAKAEAKLA